MNCCSYHFFEKYHILQGSVKPDSQAAGKGFSQGHSSDHEGVGQHLKATGSGCCNYGSLGPCILEQSFCFFASNAKNSNDSTDCSANNNNDHDDDKKNKNSSMNITSRYTSS